jgi:homoserine O-acetyltransferase/O-succinyltransferase
MKTRRISHYCVVLFASLVGLPGLGAAYDGVVEKKVFALPSFTTVNGDALSDVRFGYETCGHPNDNRDNAIFILPAVASTGHAAGKSPKRIGSPAMEQYYWTRQTIRY